MRNNATTLFSATAALIVVCGATPSAAQHADILVQAVDDRLVTGAADFDLGAWTLDQRVFSGSFTSDFFTTNPGWNALGSGSPALPAGAAALPPKTELHWDFLPIKIDGVAQPLAYWDGAGGVAFGAMPTADYRFEIQGFDGFYYSTGEAGEVAAGAAIAKTGDLGGIHDHQILFVDDYDGLLQTNPADGIYLVAVRLKMIDLDRARPLFLVMETSGAPAGARDAAVAWVEAEVDLLAPDFAADFDGDLSVDGDDLAAWQTGYGGAVARQVAGDATYDNDVNGADFLAWQRGRGASIDSFAGVSTTAASAAPIPEPASILLLLAALGVRAIAVARRDRS